MTIPQQVGLNQGMSIPLKACIAIIFNFLFVLFVFDEWRRTMDHPSSRLFACAVLFVFIVLSLVLLIKHYLTFNLDQVSQIHAAYPASNNLDVWTVEARCLFSCLLKQKRLYFSCLHYNWLTSMLKELLTCIPKDPCVSCRLEQAKRSVP